MRKGGILWLGIGVTSCLQVVSSLSILEAFVLLMAPILLLKEYSEMRKSGVANFFLLSLLLVFGCAISCLYNATQAAFALRGMAVCCLLACSIIVSHWLLRTRVYSMRWMFVGLAVGMIANIFIFQNSYVTVLTGEMQASDGLYVQGGLFWLSHFSGIVDMLPKGWYLETPMVYSVIAPIVLAAFAALSTVSGRSATLGYLGVFLLVLIGGKAQRTMKRLSKNFWLFVIMGVVGLICIKVGYQIAATKGYLGEESRLKYERQTRGDTSVRQLLLGGRIDSFVGLLACVDRPIVGWGPWAFDENGYYGEFLSKYGNEEDYAAYVESIARNRKHGVYESSQLIPVHSMFTEFWCWYGIAGLVFVLYSIFVFIRFMKYDSGTVPQWYYWLVCGMVARFWDILFSPFADRFGFSLIVVACLLARAARIGRWRLPEEMVREIQKAEMKN